MKKLCYLLLLLPCLVLGNDLPQIRREYVLAVNDEKAAEKFHQSLKNKASASPLLLAYYGSAQAIRARHAFNPYNKVAYLKSGMKSLERAVSLSPEDLEIRYLRFSLEHYIPSFLGFSKHLEEDKRTIIALSRQRKFGLMDKALLLNLLQFMKETKRCTPKEIAILGEAINNG